MKPTILRNLLLFLLAASQCGQAAELPAAPEGQSEGAEAERRFDSLTINGETYRDVLVYSRDASYIYLRHERGLSGLKVQNLDTPLLRRLGYPAEPPKPEPRRFGAAQLAMFARFFNSPDVRGMSLLTAAGVAFLIVGLYLYTSYLFWLICTKAQTRPSFVVWLPFLQVFPLLRAARMSWFWVVLLLAIPVAAIYALFHWPIYAIWLSLGGAAMASLCGILWAFRICLARKKTWVLGFLLLLPGINYFALLYLAAAD
jgi:hypothetical protein